MRAQLQVIIPIYNEEEIINVVIEDWITTLKSLKILFQLNLYNDGSSDSTLGTLKALKKAYPEYVSVVDKPNTGHGNTILNGYLQHLESEWLFQVDSDNEMRACHFEEFWNNRNHYDFIIGKRINREAPFFRKLMAFTSKQLNSLLFGKGIHDVNCPYRLIRSSIFKKTIQSIPENTFAPNILLSGKAIKSRFKNIDIEFQTRTTGTNSLNANYLKLLKICIQSFYQTIRYGIRG